MEVIAQHTQDAIVGRDLEGYITFWNPAATRLFGYSPDEAVGRSFTKLLPALNPTDDHIIERSLEDHALEDHGEHGAPVEYDHVRLGKGQKPTGVGLTIAPVRGLDGLSLGTAIVIRDVTERRRVDVELSQSDVLAAVATLAASTLQRLSSPLQQALQSITRVEGAGGESGEDVLASARENLEDAVKSLDYLKRMAKSDGEHAPPVELARIVETAIRWSALTLRTGARLQADIASTALVRADPARLSQIFIHLLDYAADAVSSKLPVSERAVSLRVYDAGPREVAVEISQNGAATAELERAHLFDFFFTDKPVQDRIGRGLASARRIVETAGGSIEVTGSDQQPTTFRVRLPRDVSTYTPTDPTPTL